MVLGRKTNCFLGKTKKTIFLEFGRIVSQKISKPSFSVFLSKTISFLRKKLVFPSKTIFFLGKTKKAIFLVSDRIVSQKMFFFVFVVFPRKKLVFLPKTIFS